MPKDKRSGVKFDPKDLERQLQAEKARREQQAAMTPAKTDAATRIQRLVNAFLTTIGIANLAFSKAFFRLIVKHDATDNDIKTKRNAVIADLKSLQKQNSNEVALIEKNPSALEALLTALAGLRARLPSLRRPSSKMDVPPARHISGPDVGKARADRFTGELTKSRLFKPADDHLTIGDKYVLPSGKTTTVPPPPPRSEQVPPPPPRKPPPLPSAEEMARRRGRKPSGGGSSHN